MTRTGPQPYPGTRRDHWYQDDFGGDRMEVNVVVLHTTEGRTLPTYSGGALAPNLTAVPDLAAKRLRWYQHFDIETSSRALANLRGGVETNTLNVCQVELVGTCDPGSHTKWKAAGKVPGVDFGCAVIPGAKAVPVTSDAMGILGGVDGEIEKAELDFVATAVDAVMNQHADNITAPHRRTAASAPRLMARPAANRA